MKKRDAGDLPHEDIQLGRIDPDPYVIGTFIFAAVSAAMSALAVHISHSSQSDERRRNQDRKRAAILRWEADLHELKDILVRLQEVIERFVPETSHSSRGSLRPLETGFRVTVHGLNALRQATSRLIRKTQQINNSSYKLLEQIDSEQLQRFLSNSIVELRQHVEELQKIRSLESSFVSAFETLGILVRTAEYLRNELVS